MDKSILGGPRLVLPRWRALAQTPSYELKSSKQQRDNKSRSQLSMGPELHAWQREKSIENATEVIEAALISGMLSSAQEAALFVLRHKDRAQPLMVRSAHYVLGYKDRRVTQPPSWMKDDALKARAHRLKRQLIDNPRDAISASELSRIYFLLGQRRPSVELMDRALKSAPDNRFVLRSAAQLFMMVGVPDKALSMLWRSDSVRGDPWIQAAEVAVADGCGVSPRYGTNSIAALLQPGPADVRHSELAAGLASWEYRSGSKRSRVRKLLNRSLTKTTENALAQALWLEDEADISVAAENFVDDVVLADEAASRIAYEKGEYVIARDAAFRWFSDQPFALDAARDYMFVSGVMLGDYSAAADVGRVALRLHPTDYSLINGQMYACAMNGDLKEARVLLDKLATFKSEERAVPFILAGSGLLAFKEGRIEDGRNFYSESIKYAKEKKYHTLVPNALFYWLEMEAQAGTAEEQYLEDTIVEIDRTLAKAPKDVRKDAIPTWEAKKKSIRSAFCEPSLRLSGEMVSVRSDRPIFFEIESKYLPKHVKL